MAELSFDDLIPKASEPDYGSAISSIESGGNYRAVGVPTRTGDRALGKYQVMSANVGPWTKEVLGRELTPGEFLGSPQAQEAVFKAKFGQYAEKYGPEGAARAWFAGERGMNNPDARDALGTSVKDYGTKFTQAMGYAPKGARAPSAPTSASLSFDDLIPTTEPDTFEQRFAGDTAKAPLNEASLKPGLDKRAEAMQSEARGAATSSPGTSMAIDFLNQGSAAGQGTTSDIAQHMPNFISADTHQNDAGELLFRDPSTGQLVPTDQNKHIALRDPSDNKIKVFARADATDRNAMESIGRLAATGMSAGAPVARPAIPAAKAAEIRPKASDVMSTAKPYYQAFRAETKDIEIPAETAQGMADRLRTALNRVNLTDDMAGAPAKSAIRMLENGDAVSIDMLQRVKRMAGRGFNNSEKDVRDGAAAISGEISKIISEVAPEASKNLKTGDAIHSTAMAMQDLQRKSDVAGLRAGRAGYGGNSVNSMRQVLSPIVQKSIEGKATGFKPDEVAAIREIVEGTAATNALRLAGQASPTKGIIQTASAIGAGALNPALLAIPALGAASNKLATIVTGKQIDRLKELVAKRSPAYAEAVQKAVNRYERAQLEFVNKPTPARLAAYATASRSLSSGLSKDGVAVSSGDLMRAIQGPMGAAADDEQPKP